MGKSNDTEPADPTRTARWWQAWQARLFGERSLGDRGERLAERYLKRQGLKIIGRQDLDQLGELDLIATDGKSIIFVEVKTRTSNVGGEPLDAVDADKQRRLTRAAMGYLQRHGLSEYPARFDVISITWSVAADKSPAGKPRIEHIKNAFDAVGTGQMFN